MKRLPVSLSSRWRYISGRVARPRTVKCHQVRVGEPGRRLGDHRWFCHGRGKDGDRRTLTTGGTVAMGGIATTVGTAPAAEAQPLAAQLARPGADHPLAVAARSGHDGHRWKHSHWGRNWR